MIGGKRLTAREILITIISFVAVLLLVAMTFVTILGVLGEGLMGGLMREANGIMLFVMVVFPIFAVVLLTALGLWIIRREGDSAAYPRAMALTSRGVVRKRTS